MKLEDKKRLLEIRRELLDLVDELQMLLRRSGNNFVYERAKAYWLGHLDNAVEGISKHDSCMDETLRDLDIDPEAESDDLEEDAEEEKEGSEDS